MRPRHACDLGIDIGSLRADVGPLSFNVADLAQEGLIGVGVRLPRVGAVPVVQLSLQFVTSRQQRPVRRRVLGQHPLHPGPEGVRRHACAPRRLVAHEGVQFGGDAQVSVADVGGGHDALP
ncbi:hypothetical protein D3C81_1885220 [compost metagenome]